MTNYFDDDSFWDDQASESTSEITRVNRRTPERTRSHHVVKRDAAPPPMRHDDAEDELWLEPVTRSTERPGSFGNIDPRLLSAGAVALVAMLAVPIFGAFGGDDGDDDAFRSIAEAQTTTTTATPTTIPIEIVITAAVDPIESDSAESDSSNASSDDGSSSDSADSASSGESASSNESAPAAPAALSAPADCSNLYDVASGDFWVSIATAADVSLDELLAANNASAETAIFPGSDVCLPDGAVIGGASAYASSGDAGSGDAGSGDAVSGDAGSGDGGVAVADEPEICSNVYEPVPGDYWLRIADVSGVPIEDLLAENNATTDTPIFPGTDICLPAGATTPTAATEPPTTSAPTTAAATTVSPTTVPPTTTAPRNTTPPPSGGAVEQMIRDVWPDDVEEEALRIAWRESNYRADVTSPTGCCVGVFQMHWEAHRSWLDDMGVTSRDQLFDARTNIEAAYALYQRNGGWGPWAL